MRKIPTLFLRDKQDMSRVIPIPNPDAAWVFAGQGEAVRKYDGTCVGYLNLPIADGPTVDSQAVLSGLRWWSRREVEPGKRAPENFVPIQFDGITGRSFGWEPIEQSGFAGQHAEALANQQAFETGHAPHWEQGTYELAGPGVNGDPDGWGEHILLAHAGAEPAHEVDAFIEKNLRDVAGLHDGLKIHLGHLRWEGIVWRHPNGRDMAMLTRRDFGHSWPITTPERPPR